MKKSLSQAIALATLVGAAASANAMNVNPDGQGEAFLMPLYTVDNGNVTTLNVTNTTDKIKAVKVRFLEGMNSKEVLDFNLYLSPYDQWSAAVGLDANGTPRIYTQDTSCTVGAIPQAGQPFVTTAYRADTNTTAPAAYKTIARAKVGHIELIEMGEVDPTAVLVTRAGNPITAGYAIVHNTNAQKVNQPGDCSAVSDAFKTGLWAANTNSQVGAPNGGLYATGAVLNVEGGWQSSYDAVALDNTAGQVLGSNVPRQFKPGSELPNFQNFSANVAFKNGEKGAAVAGTAVAAPVNAVSALLMKESIQNDYVVGAGLNAQTDLTITFPTKTFYVNGALNTTTQVHAAEQPFGNRQYLGWNRNTGMACEAVAIRYWDNEENESVLDVGEFSPSDDVEDITLCHETNILSVAGSKVIGGEGFVRHNLDLKAGFNIGWMDVDFVTRDASGANIEAYRSLTITPTSPSTLAKVDGLPAIGFSTIVIQNGDVGGLMSNYAATYEHKATTSADF